MAFLNFLTQGQPLPSTSSSLTTSQVPQYLSDYLYNLMSGAYSAAQEEYQPYSGPRLAGFSPNQLEAFNQTQGSVGAYKPQLGAAEQTATEAANLSPTAMAQPYFNAASASMPGVVSNYMNPYEENVTNRMGDIAARQIREKLMPAMNDQFIRAGQFGSTRQQELAQRGVRDIAENLSGQIGTQLAQGYTTAGQQAQEDLRRQASIGQAAGQLAGTEMTGLGNIAGLQAGLGQKEQALGLQGAAALEAVGAQQQGQQQKNLDLAYQDFLRQTQYPKEQISFLSNVVRGLPSGGGTASTATSGMGQQYSASPLAQLASAGMSAAALSSLMGGKTS
jgi:hypothetical protein